MRLWGWVTVPGCGRMMLACCLSGACWVSACVNFFMLARHARHPRAQGCSPPRSERPPAQTHSNSKQRSWSQSLWKVVLDLCCEV